MNPTGPVGQEEWITLQKTKFDLNKYIPQLPHSDKDVYELDRLLIMCLALDVLDLPFSPRLREKIQDIEDVWFDYIIEQIQAKPLYSGLINLLRPKHVLREHDVFQMLKTLDDKFALELFLLMYKEAMFYKHKPN